MSTPPRHRFDDLLLHLCVEPVAADGFAKAIAVVSANADADAPTLTVAEYAAAVQVSGPSASSAAPQKAVASRQSKRRQKPGRTHPQ